MPILDLAALAGLCGARALTKGSGLRRERSSRNAKDMLSATMSAVINSAMRFFIFSPPCTYRQRKTDHLLVGR